MSRFAVVIAPFNGDSDGQVSGNVGERFQVVEGELFCLSNLSRSLSVSLSRPPERDIRINRALTFQMSLGFSQPAVKKICFRQRSHFSIDMVS